MEENSVSLRGIVVSKASLEEKYKLELSDTEWKILSTYLQKSWAEDAEEIRKLVFKHVKKSFENIGYKLDVGNDGLLFKKN